MVDAYLVFVCWRICCVCLYLYEEGKDGYTEGLEPKMVYSVDPFNNDVIRGKALWKLSHFKTYRGKTSNF